MKIVDLGNADPSSSVVAEQKITCLSFSNEENKAFLYLVPTSELVEGKEYSLLVHIDADGDGNVSEVDYITVQQYPFASDIKTLDVMVHKLSGD